jgi:hypothetical protein
VRTKKEILDADGNIRPGCRILKKGEIYDIKWFSGRKDVFKDRNFLDDVKVLYTDLINKVVEHEEDRLQIFDASGPYLATKKIGKNNPREDEIRSDNQLRQEWNQTVDQVLIAGGSQEEVTAFKREEVVQKVSESVQIHGPQPGLLEGILRRAIAVLKEFLDLLMQSVKEEPEVRETGKVPAGQDPNCTKSRNPSTRIPAMQSFDSCGLNRFIRSFTKPTASSMHCRNRKKRSSWRWIISRNPSFIAGNARSCRNGSMDWSVRSHFVEISCS